MSQKMICCKVPIFVTWVQQKAEPEAPEAYVLAFYRGYYSKEQKNKEREAAREEQTKLFC